MARTCRVVRGRVSRGVVLSEDVVDFGSVSVLFDGLVGGTLGFDESESVIMRGGGTSSPNSARRELASRSKSKRSRCVFNRLSSVFSLALFFVFESVSCGDDEGSFGLGVFFGWRFCWDGSVVEELWTDSGAVCV